MSLHMQHGHFRTVCPECGVGMGGCRCMAVDKVKVKATAPCHECWAKRDKPMTDPADLRGKLLAWIDERLRRWEDAYPVGYEHALRALRGEVERHSMDRETWDGVPWCAACLTLSGEDSDWPCPTLRRIASQLGVEP